MRFVRTALLATLGTAALAGAAIAADRTMLVAFPDGSVQHIAVSETTAPRILVVQAPAPISIFGPGSPFAEIERISAMMDAQADAMLRRAAMIQAQTPLPAASGQGIVMTNAQGQPVGVMHYSFTSSTTSADGCTQTVSYSSDGSSGSADQPKVIRTSAGSCANSAPTIAPARGSDRAVTPTASEPVAKPKPRITPVSAPRPLPDFTPSRT